MKIGAVLRQSLPLLLLCGVGEVFAGTLFGRSTEALKLIPGLIVLVPALIGLRGNINSTMGSRLGSAAHMGLISSENFWNDEMKANFKASLILSVVMSFIAGLLAVVVIYASGNSSANILLKIVAIAVLAGSISGILLAFITIAIIMYAFKRGLDPDNVVGPSLATVGDVITLSCIFGVAFLIGGI